jgi:hypothetical protein
VISLPGSTVHDLGHRVVNPVTRGIWRVARGGEAAVSKAPRRAVLVTHAVRLGLEAIERIG